MHRAALDRARFVNDSLEQPPHRLMRERAGIGGFSAFQHFPFAIGLIEREVFLLLVAADFHGAARPFVQQLDELAVDLINAAAPVVDFHGAASLRLRPRRAASLKPRTRLAREAAAASGVAARAISVTRAEPMTAASARPPRIETCPGREMPNPTAIGSEVIFRTRRSSAGRSSGSASFAPVTPAREMT